MKTCSKCGRIYADDLLVYCLEDGTPLSAPLTNQISGNQTTESEETLVLPKLSEQETFRFSSSGDTKPITSTINKAPWFLFGGSLLVIIGLVLIIGIFVGVNLFSAKNTNTVSKQNDNQRRPSINQNENKPDDEDVETALKNLNGKIAAAYCQPDTAFLENALADEYTYKDDRGFYTTKPQIISWLQTGTASYDYIRASNVVIRVEANKQRAIVAGKGEIKGSLNGQGFVDTFFFRNVYEKRNDRWQLVSVGIVH